MIMYEVTVTRDDGLWAAVISGLPPLMIGATDVERFADLDVEVRDLIAGLTDTDPDSFGLAWRYVFGGQDVTEIIIDLTGTEHAYAQAVADRDAARREAIRALLEANLSQSAIGDVLGLSHQRIHQLAKAG
ncbi:MAG: MerR [Actinobacteria bacterium]|nr:MerR [Actinomycetota bacterium]